MAPPRSSGLILHDARAEMNDGVLTASSSRFTANGLTSSGAKVNGISASNLRLRNEKNSFAGSIASVKANEVTAADMHVKDVSANNIDFAATPAGTSVNIKEILVGGIKRLGRRSCQLQHRRRSPVGARRDESKAQPRTSLPAQSSSPTVNWKT